MEQLFFGLGVVVFLIVIVWNVVLGILFIRLYQFITETKREINYYKNSLKYSILNRLLSILGGGDRYK